jgi:hypothetical protein
MLTMKWQMKIVLVFKVFSLTPEVCECDEYV